jgi:hypothetical protein
MVGRELVGSPDRGVPYVIARTLDQRSHIADAFGIGHRPVAAAAREIDRRGVGENLAPPFIEVVIDAERPAGNPRVLPDAQFLVDSACRPPLTSALATTSPLRTISSEPSGKMLRTAARTLTVPGPDSPTVPPGSHPSTESVTRPGGDAAPGGVLQCQILDAGAASRMDHVGDTGRSLREQTSTSVTGARRSRLPPGPGKRRGLV